MNGRLPLAARRVPRFSHGEYASFWTQPPTPAWSIPGDTFVHANLGKPLTFTGPTDPHNQFSWGLALTPHWVLRPRCPDNRVLGRALNEIPENVPWSMLSAHLECEKLDVPASLVLQDNGQGEQAIVRVVDSVGCAAELSFLSTKVSEDERHAFAQFINYTGTVLEDLQREARAHMAMQTRLDEYRQWLRRYSAMLAVETNWGLLRPQWTTTKYQGNGTGRYSYCEHRYIFGGFSDPLTMIEDGNLVSRLQVASCLTHFHVGAAFLEVKRTAAQTPFVQQGVNAGASFQQELLSVTTPQRDTWRPIQEDFPSSAYDLYNHFLRHDIDHQSLFDPLFHYQLLHHRALTLDMAETDSYHTIAYGSSVLLSALHQRLAAAAAVTMSETNAKNKTPGQSVWHGPRQYLEHSTLQRTLWFQTLYYSTILFSMIAIYRAYHSVDSTSSQLPWDITSIASRAILLHRSRLSAAFDDIDDPDATHHLRPLAIGWFADSSDDNAHSWRVDSLLNQCAVRISPGATYSSQKRHSLLSLPLYARPIIPGLVIASLAAVTAMGRAALRHIQAEAALSGLEAKLTNLVRGLLGPRTEVYRTFGEVLGLKLVPVIATMALVIGWWDLLISFYKIRVPWVGLTRACRAQESLTLDYINHFLPVAKAVRNGHWMLATLVASSLIVLPLPTLIMNFYSEGWALADSEKVLVARNHSWNYESEDVHVTGALQGAVWDAMQSLDYPALPLWISHEQALLPVDWETLPGADAPRTERADIWEVESETIKGTLSCKRKRHKRLAAGKLSLTLAKGDALPDGTTRLTVDPCYGDPPRFWNYRRPAKRFCSHWDFVTLISDSGTGPERTAWVISAADYSRSSAHPRDWTEVLLCEPRIIAGKGRAQLIMPNMIVREPRVYAFHSQDEPAVLKNGLAQRYSEALNRSIFSVDRGREGELDFDTPEASSAHFQGDILSLIAYRWALRTKMPLHDAGSLANASSTVFSTIFARAVHEVGFLNVPADPQYVEAIRHTWSQEVFIHKPVLRLLYAYGFLVVAVTLAHGFTMFYRKEYRFPIAPEPLENSWFLLSGSRVIQEIGERIEHPERLTLRGFYARVNELDLKYAFERRTPQDSWTKARVHVAEDLDRDSPRESTEGGVRCR